MRKIQIFLIASKLVSENWYQKRLKLMHSPRNKDIYTTFQILDSYPKFRPNFCKKKLVENKIEIWNPPFKMEGYPMLTGRYTICRE